MSWIPTRIDRIRTIRTPEWGNHRHTKIVTSKALSVLCLSGLMLSTAGVQLSSVVAQTTIDLAQLPGPAPEYNVLFVNSTAGDNGGNGSEQAPFKTITQALRVVQANTIIQLAPGTYSAETGEVFPLQLKSGTTIKGEPRDRGQAIVIQGGGFFLSRAFARQNVTIVGANQAGLTGVTVTNPNRQGYGLWIESTSPVITDNTFTKSDHDGVSVVGSSAPILRNNYFYQNGANGITIYGTSRPELQENIFEKTGFGINIAQNAAPRLIENRVTQNKDGIVTQGKAQPILRGNVVDSNERDGLVAIAQSQPNLGTAADPGNNTFLSNGQFDINAKTSSQTIVTFGNQIASNKTSGKLDFSGTASVASISVAPPRRVASSIRSSQAQADVQPSPTSAKGDSTLSPISLAVTIPVPRPAKGTSPAPEAQRTPLFSRPAATSVRRLPQPKQGLVPQTQVAPPIPASISAAPAQRPSLFNRATAEQAPDGAIEIPVPAPESGSVAAPAVNQSLQPPLAAAPSAALPGQDVLPVPGPDAPIGNVGDMSAIPIWRNLPQSTAGNSSAPQSIAMGLRYRVVVEAENESQQAQIRAIVPDAFPLASRGGRVMQVGTFSDRAKADELLQTLASQGLTATIEQR